MRSTKTKEQIFTNSLSLFVDEPIPNELLQNYLNDTTGDYTSDLQGWIVFHMKDEISDWCTGIGIIEAVKHLYNTALENGNLSLDQTF